MTVEIRSGRGVVFLWMAVMFPGYPDWDDYCWYERVPS